MNTPINAEAESYSRSTRNSKPDETIIWPLIECLGGGISAGGVFLFLLPMLADVMSPFGALAPTGLLIMLLFLWLFLWLLTAVVRERVIS